MAIVDHDEIQNKAADDVAEEYLNELILKISSNPLVEPEEPFIELVKVEAEFCQLDLQTLSKELEEQRTVVLEMVRPVRDSIEMNLCKEYESTWINELKRFDTLGRQDSLRSDD